MRYLRILHIGDPSGARGTPSPRWEVCVSEDGSVWGELETGNSARMLPSDFRIPDHHLFFDIPREMKRDEFVRLMRPNYDGVIASLVAPGGLNECTFLMTQLPDHSPLRAALEDVEKQIRQLTEPPAGGNAE